MSSVRTLVDRTPWGGQESREDSPDLLGDEAVAKRERVMAALLGMKKLDIEKLKAA